jgi:hypothetical protein
MTSKPPEQVPDEPMPEEAWLAWDFRELRTRYIRDDVHERVVAERDEAVAWQKAKEEWIDVAERTLQGLLDTNAALRAQLAAVTEGKRDAMMTDESVIEWALGWLRDNPPDDPTFRERFAAGLRRELAARVELPCPKCGVPDCLCLSK